jgi:RNA polymerase sigma-70 factor (ECF subfamily)
MASSGRTSPSRTSGARFAATRWSVVLAAADHRAGTASRRALGELIQVYWFPLYAFIRRQGNSPPQAEDLTQGFFAHLVEKAGLGSVDRAKGKFRSFLLAALKNFMADERDKARAVKRGGNRRLVSLDTPGAEALYAKELADTMTPERLFERSWAIAVLDQVLLRLEQEYAERGKAATFQALRHWLDGRADDKPYSEHAGQLGMSEGAVRVAVHRMRRRYRELLRDEIMQTVAGPELVEEEIHHLLRCL